MVSDRTSAARTDDEQQPAVRCFVSVERYEVPRTRPSPGREFDGRAPALSLAVHTPSGDVVLRATEGAARPEGRQVLDEHFVVNADAHHEQRWLDCADLLLGSRARPVGDAIGWLRAISAGRAACRMAAVPLAKGGWAVLDTARQQVTLLPVTTPRGQWLWPSCLLGWLTAGGSLHELMSAKPAYHSPAAQGS
ncbi:hypothetical protein GA0115240_10614 [Streptomyces sp. DvalAA-14]|uniref:hypothetical protein n=1 Tax=unclassified Streptomyces TaxID=2593676 RepID=UPI00081B90E8|nr:MULTISPECIES: hypothetical protein [unclassified Streptomyces]MYS19194.1 hypothetical protein [Streptomyces sp. SID4948]SCD38889.1 hypothetical protein GA0115240_10614 [Streptomyces sp. DvalAA-14]